MKLSTALGRATLVAGSGVLSLICVELALRWTFGSPLEFREPQPRYVATPYSYKLEPGQRSFIGDKPVAVNRHGFRDDEWTLQKPAGGARIMILGDSMAFGYHVVVEDTFASQIERELRKIEPRAEVMLTAVSGWNPKAELGFLREEGVSFEPDLIVLTFFINDFNSELPFDTTAIKAGAVIDTRPYLSRWLPEPAVISMKRSAFLYLLRRRLLNETFLDLVRGQPSIEARLMADQIDLDTDPNVRSTYQDLELLKALAEERELNLTVAFMPNYELLKGDGPPAFAAHLARFCDTIGVPFIDPSSNFRQSANLDALFLRPWDNAHYSAAGHRVVADALLAQLKPWLDRHLKGHGS